MCSTQHLSSNVFYIINIKLFKPVWGFSCQGVIKNLVFQLLFILNNLKICTECVYWNKKHTCIRRVTSSFQLKINHSLMNAVFVLEKHKLMRVKKKISLWTTMNLTIKSSSESFQVSIVSPGSYITDLFLQTHLLLTLRRWGKSPGCSEKLLISALLWNPHVASQLPALSPAFGSSAAPFEVHRFHRLPGAGSRAWGHERRRFRSRVRERRGWFVSSCTNIRSRRGNILFSLTLVMGGRCVGKISLLTTKLELLFGDNFLNLKFLCVSVSKISYETGKGLI